MATKVWKENNKEKMRLYRRTWYAKNRAHAKRRVMQRKKELRQWLDSLKEDLKCNRCDENHISCLEFHHKNPKKKEIAISLAPNYGWSKERILKEIKKCEVLCANCHRKEHYGKK